MITPLIAAPVRTPIGRFGGALAGVRPDDLLAHALRACMDRAGLPPDAVDDVIAGCANQAGEDNRNVARMAALLAGCPPTTPGVTVNRLCASGLEAVNWAARAVATGDADVVLAGGVESMSRAPYSVPRNATGEPATGNLTAWDTSLGWRYPNPRMEALFPLEAMGCTAENLAARHGISREAQDAFALESHRRACAAWDAGAFADEVAPVEAPARKGPPGAVVDRDEGPRPDTTAERLARLKPAFRAGGTVTAGNSSTLSDGAAALLVVSPAAADRLGLRPVARWVAGAAAGVDPEVMGIGPVPATRKALARANAAGPAGAPGARGPTPPAWTLAGLDLIELNEAFAAQALACMAELGLPADRTNVRGGALALGHPLGMSGARILATLLHALHARGGGRGLATLCVGVGQGVATLVETVG